MQNVTTSSFADAIGRKKIADAIGVGLTAVSNGVVRGAFPASWFKACEALATDAGVECPPELFQQRPLNPQFVEGGGKNQGDAA